MEDPVRASRPGPDAVAGGAVVAGGEALEVGGEAGEAPSVAGVGRLGRRGGLDGGPPMLEAPRDGRSPVLLEKGDLRPLMSLPAREADSGTC